MRSLLALLIGALFICQPAWADSDAISRLYTFMPNTTVSSSQMNAELNQLINTMNAKPGTGTNSTISGAKTFSQNITITATPSASTHAVTKGYVDGITTGHASAPPVWASNTTFTVAYIRERSSDGSTIIQTSGSTTVDVGHVFDGSSYFGGLDTGTVANNTFYYLYAVCKSDGTGTGLVLSTVNESVSGSITLASGYTKKKQMSFFIRTDGSAHIWNFQVGTGWPNAPAIWYRKDTLTYWNGSSTVQGTKSVLYGASGTYTSQVPSFSVASYVPPIATRVMFHAYVTGTLSGTTPSNFIAFGITPTTIVGTSMTDLYPLQGVSNDAYFEIAYPDTSATYYYARLIAVNGGLNLDVLGCVIGGL